jgi:hypothetical protein
LGLGDYEIESLEEVGDPCPQLNKKLEELSSSDEDEEE